MSSLRNAVKRVEHKERAQPVARRRLGLLEKHKDYVLRARDYAKKRDHMKALKVKAAMKNPDEFYFAMNKTKTKEGIHEIEGGHSLPDGVIQLMKTQDLGYVATKRAEEERKVDKLRETLHFLDAGPRNKRKIFFESHDEARSFDATKHFDMVPELAGSSFKRPRKKNLLETTQVTGATNGKQLKKIYEKRDMAYKELSQRLQRVRNMKVAETRLRAQRTLMTAKGTKQKVQPAENGNPAVYRWKQERAR
ncbi:unnamed protein product [Choristocarpus tenellus]